MIGEKIIGLEVSDRGNNKPKCPFKITKQCDPRIIKINQYGQVFIKFPLPLHIPNASEYKNVSRMLKFELKSAFYPSTQSNVTKWVVVDFKTEDMTVNLTFSDSEKVSKYYFDVRDNNNNILL